MRMGSLILFILNILYFPNSCEYFSNQSIKSGFPTFRTTFALLNINPSNQPKNVINSCYSSLFCVLRHHTSSAEHHEYHQSAFYSPALRSALHWPSRYFPTKRLANRLLINCNQPPSLTNSKALQRTFTRFESISMQEVKLCSKWLVKKQNKSLLSWHNMQ